MLYLIGPQTKSNETICCFDNVCCELWSGSAITITYPYNPDGNADSLIGASDIQDLLSIWLLPSLEILVDGQTLTTVLTQLKQH